MVSDLGDRPKAEVEEVRRKADYQLPLSVVAALAIVDSACV